MHTVACSPSGGLLMSVSLSPDVRHLDIQRWCTGLTRKGLAAATVDKVHRVLSQVLDLAVLDQRIPRNRLTA